MRVFAPGFALASGLSCMRDSGTAVDFFDVLIHPGAGKYSYLEGGSSDFVQSVGSMSTATAGAVGLTLKQLYANHADLAYAMYNDEKPTGEKTSSYAHAKGVVVFDGKTGFWLIHSVPKWPPAAAKGYGSPESSTYGQSVRCVTLSASSMEEMAGQLMVARPWIYDSNMPSSISSPQLSSWIGGGYDKDSTTKTTTIVTKGGVSFTHFAKSKTAGNDLYEDVVAPGLKQDLVAETWQNGRGDLGAFCKPTHTWEVVDVKSVEVNGETWTINQDHSKWCVTKSSNYVCVGDMNRQSGQEKRGGGTLCLSDSATYKAFTSVIQGKDTCSSDVVV
mmetsp:Transcript_113489/g.260364  ORF Transcript_113489/g.260364 Transcript_113489/m.260364 type:complete len:332 (+) Transcript_113489:84-1079(+)